MTFKRKITLLILALPVIYLVVSGYRFRADYKDHMLRARETVLVENLQRMRQVIHDYRDDKKRYPANINTLIEEGYLRTYPIDPITRRKDTWIQIKTSEGLVNVKSGAKGHTLDDNSYGTL